MSSAAGFGLRHGAHRRARPAPVRTARTRPVNSHQEVVQSIAKSRLSPNVESPLSPATGPDSGVPVDKYLYALPVMHVSRAPGEPGALTSVPADALQ